MTENSANTIYKKGVENLLILPKDFNKDKYYSSKEKEDDYGAVTITKSLDKMKLCDDICSFDDNALKNMLAKIYVEISKLLLIK